MTTEQPAVQAVVAMASPHTRARTLRQLREMPELALLGQASSAFEAIGLAEALRPALLLVDIAMALDPELPPLLAQLPPPTPGIVLLTEDARISGAGLPIPLAAILPLDLPAAELTEYLRTLVDAAPRVHLAAEPPRQHTPPEADRRRAAQDRLRIVAEGLEVDPLTGLAGVGPLERAVATLQALQYPVTVLAIELRYARSSVAPTESTVRNALIRLAGAALRAALRQDDLLGRVHGAMFALILPGLDGAHHDVVARRLRASIEGLDCSRHAYGVHLRVALAVTPWEPGMAPVPLVDRAVAAARDASSHT